MTEKPIRRYELCTERLETLEDVIKIIKALQIRIDTDNPLYEELQYSGYLKLYEKVGPDEFYKMTYEEIERKGFELLQNEKTN
jgi:hypothetical protein